MNIISNCPLCEEHSLHIIGEKELQTQQCINCGYVTAERYKIKNGNADENTEYKKLSEEMQNWSKINGERIWLPTMMALPFGMLYPINIDNMVNHKKEIKWAFSELINIPEEEQKNYPIPESDNKQFYKTKYDTDNQIIYDTFLEGISILNKKIKQQEKENSNTDIGVKLPKLKKG